MLNGWTKVGDEVTATGRWELYRHKTEDGTLLDSIKSFEVSEKDLAYDTYEKKASTLRTGGLWLVDPWGTVQAVTFIAKT